jgi:hypothetical protein
LKRIQGGFSMSLQTVEEDFLIDMDSEANALYRAMRDAENDWIAATGFRHLDLGNRTHLLIADKLDLPSHDELAATRRAFKSWLDDNREDKPETIGNRSTALPVWLTRDGKRSIAETLSEDSLISATEVRIRRQPAARGTKLNRLEIEELVAAWIYQAKKSIANRIKNRRKTLLAEAELDLKELEEQQREISKLMQEYDGRISARRSTGMATHIRIKAAGKQSWPATIATVGLVYGNSETKTFEFTDRQRRPKEGQQTPIATIGNLVFYRSDTMNVSH